MPQPDEPAPVIESPKVLRRDREDSPKGSAAPPAVAPVVERRSLSPVRPPPRVVDDELDDFEPASSASPSLPGVRDPSPLRKSPPTSNRPSAPSSAVPSPRHSPRHSSSSSSLPSVTVTNAAAAAAASPRASAIAATSSPRTVAPVDELDDELDMDMSTAPPAPVAPQPVKQRDEPKTKRPAVDDDELDLPSDVQLPSGIHMGNPSYTIVDGIINDCCYMVIAIDNDPAVAALGDFYGSSAPQVLFSLRHITI